MSNFVLTGARTLTSLGYTLSNLIKRYGIKVVQGRVTAITPSASGGTVTVGTTTIAYDRLVLAPGLDFEAVPGVAADRATILPARLEDRPADDRTASPAARDAGHERAVPDVDSGSALPLPAGAL